MNRKAPWLVSGRAGIWSQAYIAFYCLSSWQFSNSALEGSPHTQFQGEVSFWFLYGNDKASQDLMVWINEMFYRATHGSWECNLAESPCLKVPL